jgi:hypothetical protein
MNGELSGWGDFGKFIAGRRRGGLERLRSKGASHGVDLWRPRFGTSPAQEKQCGNKAEQRGV